MDPAHVRAIKASFQPDGSTKFSDVPTSAAPNLKTKTVLRDLILGDWAPTMEAIARALALAVAIPAAVLIVFAQWLAFTWRRPLAGVLALVPVRKPDPIDAISVAALTRSELCHIGATETMDEVLADVAAGFGLTADDLLRPITFAYSYSNLADAALKLASICPRSDESFPQSEPVAPQVTEISPALDAPLDQALGLKRPVRPVGPDGLVLAPAPRRQRRGSKRPQSPA